MPATKKKSLYSVHPGVAMVQKWIHDLPSKTGRTLDQWVEFINTEGPASGKECRDWLKKQHGFGSNTASWLAERAHGNDTGLAEEDPKQYLKMAEQHVEKMFQGARAGLKPLYDQL